jgi:hypothetical protein
MVSKDIKSGSMPTFEPDFIPNKGYHDSGFSSLFLLLKNGSAITEMRPSTITSRVIMV